MKQSASKRNVDFFYETSVGAGLPVISTLGDLLRSGDKIIEIEAILSGTLSFIFNTFCAETLVEKGQRVSFSEVIETAMRLGYTEPDPRDDLSGRDAARKLLILARECGLDYELGDIVVEPLVPDHLMDCSTVTEFIKKLPEINEKYEGLRAVAEERREKLAFIGILNLHEVPRIALRRLELSHPFYSLSGSDNIISFKTERYNKQPLVVRGPGAGAEVTAAGVFADIMRVATYRR